MIKATCVLITREKVYPQEVLDTLPSFDEVLIETECPSIHRRYELALKAKNDLIYVQDDDCITDVYSLLDKYNGQLTNALDSHQLSVYKGTGMTLVGYGCFFPKSMVSFDKYFEDYPIDALFLSQTDRVFSFLNQPHNSQVVDIKTLPRATDPNRMYHSPDHWDNLRRIQERLHNLSAFA